MRNEKLMNMRMGYVLVVLHQKKQIEIKHWIDSNNRSIKTLHQLADVAEVTFRKAISGKHIQQATLKKISNNLSDLGFPQIQIEDYISVNELERNTMINQQTNAISKLLLFQKEGIAAKVVTHEARQYSCLLVAENQISSELCGLPLEATLGELRIIRSLGVKRFRSWFETFRLMCKEMELKGEITNYITKGYYYEDCPSSDIPSDESGEILWYESADFFKQYQHLINPVHRLVPTTNRYKIATTPDETFILDKETQTFKKSVLNSEWSLDLYPVEGEKLFLEVNIERVD